MFYQKKTKKLGGLSQVFYVYVTCFLLLFLLRKFFKTVGDLLHLLTLHLKLTFWGALKKALMVLEDRSYQTQSFGNTFQSPLASTLHIHFSFHLKESCENAL